MTPLSEISWALSLRTWLLEPAPEAHSVEAGRSASVASPPAYATPGGEAGHSAPVASPPGPLTRVAVVGLGPACGTTTVARGIAAALAVRHPTGVAIVAFSSHAAGPSLPPLRAASRLAARLPGSTASGRLCLWQGHDPAGAVVGAGGLAPLVFDVPHDGPASDSASLADATVLVVPGDAEPALAELAAHTLARHGRAPLTVVNRPSQPGRWDGRAAALLPDSRMAVRLAHAGWQPPGRLGQMLAALADECGTAA